MAVDLSLVLEAIDFKNVSLVIVSVFSIFAVVAVAKKGVDIVLTALNPNYNKIFYKGTFYSKDAVNTVLKDLRIQSITSAKMDAESYRFLKRFGK